MHDNDFDEKEKGQEEDKLDSTNSSSAFTILQGDFTKTVADIKKNSNMSTQADTYIRLFEAFNDTNEKREKLLEKYTKLEEQVAEDVKKINLSFKQAEADAATVFELKSKLEHAYKLADGAHDREQQAHEIIDNLRNQIHALTVELDLKNKLGADHAADARQLRKYPDLQRENGVLMGEVSVSTKVG